MADVFDIAGRINSTSNEHVVTTADQIKDEDKNKKQSQINAETISELATHESRLNAYTEGKFVTVDTYSGLPATGVVDTVYRVSSWDGTANSGQGAVDVTKYSEYAWENGAYKFLDVKTQIGEVFDISEYNNATYIDLADALSGTNVPQDVKRGGMSVKYVSSSDNNYVQYRLMKDTWSTDTEDWAVCSNDYYVENPEYIRVILDKDKRLIAYIKTNGEIEWSRGVPTPVREYVIQMLENGLDTKVNKEDGKSLINAIYAGSVESNDREENYADVELDKDKSIISCIEKNGKKTHYTEHNFRGGVNVEKYLKINGTEVSVFIKQGEEHDYNDYTIDFTLENGIFDGSGGNYSSNNHIRTPKMSASDDYMYAVLFPNTFNCMGNFDGLNGTNYQFDAPFSFKGSSISTFFRLAFYRKDSSSPLQIENLTTEERAAIKILKVPYINSEWDVFIARNDSPEYARKHATMTINETDSQSVLQAFIGCLNTIRINLDGYFYLNTNHVINTSNQVCALNTRQYRILEDYQTVYIHGGYIEETATLHNLWNNEDENIVFCCPRKAVAKNTHSYIMTYIEMHNVYFRCYYYDKALTCIDTTQAWNTRLDNISVRGTTIEPATGNGTPFKITPHSEYVGIRVSHGSNGGKNDWIKHCFVVYFNKAFSISGEHFVIEDCLAHHNYVGFVFGDMETAGHFEHPNVMIGCSIEGCYRLMLLTKNGETTEGPFVYDNTNNHFYSTLRCIGLSTEYVWDIPTDERVEGEPTTLITKPILEILKGAYRGKVEADYRNYPFEEGSGTHMRWVTYNMDKTYIGYSNICERTIE